MSCPHVSFRLPVASMLIMVGLLLVGCSGTQQPPGEVIEIETIEIIEPDEPVGQESNDNSPAPQEPTADASN
jgi:hypothetical protein